MHRWLPLLLAVLPAHPAAQTVVRPNVLFVAIDDLNDWVGCLGGHSQAHTPNLDRLAGEGVLFTNAYCPAPACNPSRTAVFTGRAPHHSGVYGNRQDMRTVLPDEVLLPRYLSDRGYWSAGGGKLLHYFVDPQSWDAYFPSIERRSPFPRTLYPGERPVTLPHLDWMYVETDWGPLDATLDEYGGDHLVASWAEQQLTREHPEPFFLAAGIYRPHEPWFVPRRFFEMFPLDEVELPAGYREDDLDDVPEAGRKLARNRYFDHIQSHDLWRSGVQGYLASIAFADEMVGRILTAVDEGPHRDNTIVVVWSDHGWHLGEKEHWQKYTGWRVCARVPLWIRVPPGLRALPDGTPRGARCDQPVSLTDLFPTLMELTGTPPKPGLDGHSLVELLRDPDAAWPHLALTQLADPQGYALSGARFRYLHYRDGSEELYDIVADPHEWTNLAGDAAHAETLEVFRAAAPQDFAPKIRTGPDPLADAKPEVELPLRGPDAGPCPTSRAAGARTLLVFENRRSTAVELAWVKPTGERRSYGQVAPGESRRMPTFARHAWELTTTDGVVLGHVVAVERPARVVVGGEDGAGTRPD